VPRPRVAIAVAAAVGKEVEEVEFMMEAVA
jgi:hypothetical protein